MSEVTIRTDREQYSGEVILDGFGPGLDDWHQEGLGEFCLDGDRMLIDAREGGYSAFYKTELPADMAVRYRVKSAPPYQQNNFNLISHCRPPEPGWPIVELGRYPGYREFENYIVTFVSARDKPEWGDEDYTAGRVRFRRNPGFELNREQYPDSVYGKEYEIVYAVVDGTMHYYIDGTKIDDWRDPEPLGGGFFAFRTYCTVAEYRDPLFIAL
ncbi:MAG: hypothetical protein ACOC8E_06875 [Planctomycetota bacterium]